MIGLIGNMLEIIENVYGNVFENILLQKGNNLELGRYEICEMDII